MLSARCIDNRGALWQGREQGFVEDIGRFGGEREQTDENLGLLEKSQSIALGENSNARKGLGPTAPADHPKPELNKGSPGICTERAQSHDADGAIFRQRRRKGRPSTSSL